MRSVDHDKKLLILLYQLHFGPYNKNHIMNPLHSKPIITCLIGFVCMIFFGLDKYYDQAVADLAVGKLRETDNCC